MDTTKEEPRKKENISKVAFQIVSYPWLTIGPFSIRIAHFVVVGPYFLLRATLSFIAGLSFAESWTWLPGVSKAVNVLFALITLYITLGKKSHHFFHRFLEVTRLDPSVLRKRLVPDRDKPASHWTVRGFTYVVFAISLATLIVFFSLLKPLSYKDAYFLIIEHGILGKPPVSTLWLNIAGWTMVAFIVAEVTPVIRWFVKKTTLVRYITGLLAVLIVWQLILWYVPTLCPEIPYKWLQRFHISCPE